MTDEDEMTESDPVTCPAHYAGDGIVDCKRAIRSMLAGYDHMASYESAYWCATALKYLWRERDGTRAGGHAGGGAGRAQARRLRADQPRGRQEAAGRPQAQEAPEGRGRVRERGVTPAGATGGLAVACKKGASGVRTPLAPRPLSDNPEQKGRGR